MVIFVVLQSNSIAHQQKTIRQPSVAKVDLRPCLELVLAAADHHEIVKLVFGPFASEILSVGVNDWLCFGLLLVPPYFFLPQAITISIGSDLIEKFLYQFEILNIFCMDFDHPLQPLILRHRHGFLNSFVDLFEVE